jgi:hypothetical protein
VGGPDVPRSEELGEDGVPRGQLLGRALVDDLAALEHDDVVGESQQRRAVGDRHHRAVRGERGQTVDDTPLQIGGGNGAVTSSSSTTRGSATKVRPIDTSWATASDSSSPPSPTTVS